MDTLKESTGFFTDILISALNFKSLQGGGGGWERGEFDWTQFGLIFPCGQKLMSTKKAHIYLI